MKKTALLAAALVGMSGLYATPAAAQTAPADGDNCTFNGNGIAGTSRPRSCLSVSSAGAGGGGQYAGSRATIVNGRQDNGNTDSHAGGTASTSWTNGGWTNSGIATSNTGGIAEATGDLTTGTLHGYISNGGDFFRGGSVNTRISDIITFNNTSGSAVTLDIGYAIDGSFSRTGSNLDGYTNGLVLFAMTNNPSNQAGVGTITYAGTSTTASDTATSVFDAQTGIMTQYRAAANDVPAFFNFTGGMTGGVVNGGFNTSLSIPTGMSQFGLAMTLFLDCRASNIVCDFGHTSALQFGPLPTGLSYTSASGVLLSANQNGAVPEPASWAMMIAGFSLAGSMMRRKPTRRIAFG